MTHRRLRLITLSAALVLAGGAGRAEDGGGASLESSLGQARAAIRDMRALADALPMSSPEAEDPCSAQAPAAPVRSGEDKTIWAETSACLPFSLQKLSDASWDIDVMVWEGITRINAVTALEPEGPLELARRRRVDYESRKRYLGCHTAHFPMEWSQRIVHGSAKDPQKAAISFTKVDGADFNGSYIKVWKGRVELSAAAGGKTALRMRYEISAPTQTPELAAGAVRAYVERLKVRAAGSPLPGPVDNPDCPY